MCHMKQCAKHSPNYDLVSRLQLPSSKSWSQSQIHCPLLTLMVPTTFSLCDERRRRKDDFRYPQIIGSTIFSRCHLFNWIADKSAEMSSRIRWSTVERPLHQRINTMVSSGHARVSGSQGEGVRTRTSSLCQPKPPSLSTIGATSRRRTSDQKEL